MKNKTKKITEGAMFLAIICALLLVNRGLSFMFDTYVHIITSIICILYITKHGFKYGAIFSVALLIVSFLFGGSYVLIYTPLSIIVGFVYAYGIIKDISRFKVLSAVIFAYIIGEFLVTLLVLPLLGFNGFEEVNIVATSIMEAFNISLSEDVIIKMVKACYIFSIMLLGILEGILIHFLTVLIFKKFHIKNLKVTPLDEIKLKPVYAYVLMALVFLLLLVNRFEVNDIIYYVLTCTGLLSAFVLFAMGSIFVLLWGIIVKRRNLGLLYGLVVIFLFPYSIIVVMILGFLYSTGPLDNYLKSKRG